MVTSLPRVHVAVMGIEKIAPTWDDAAAWLSLLARSATGQAMSIYTTVVTGPARAADADGPQRSAYCLLDNGRSTLIGTPYEEVLQCIRCGACLNICPVYREAGGHAYGSPYSGPIGAVITPLLFGLEEYRALPHASSLCGACQDRLPGAHRPAAHAAGTARGGSGARAAAADRQPGREGRRLCDGGPDGAGGWARGCCAGRSGRSCTRGRSTCPI